MRAIVIFLVAFLFAGVVSAQESKYFNVDSTRERLIIVDPLDKKDVVLKDVVLRGDYGYMPQKNQEWKNVMDSLCLEVFKDLPSDYKEFLHRVFIVVTFNKYGDIGNEILFIPRERFQEIFAYEELLYQYILELRKINMLPYVDINPAYFSTAVRRIMLAE
ncbi:hypothetical protein [Parabacteroides sp.]